MPGQRKLPSKPWDIATSNEISSIGEGSSMVQQPQLASAENSGSLGFPKYCK